MSRPPLLCAEGGDVDPVRAGRPAAAQSEEPLPPLVVAWGGLAVGGIALPLAAVVGVLPMAAPRTGVTAASCSRRSCSREVLVAVVFAWVLLGQALSPVQLLEGLLVVAGIALVRLGELRAAEQPVAGTPSQELLARVD